MDFEIEKLLAKVSGENVEIFAAHVISDTDKKQINFAFEQMFNGISLLEWVSGGVLVDAWNIALDKVRDFIFNLEESSYITDYLRVAVFDFRKHNSKDFHNSVHACEYFHSDVNVDILRKSAQDKIQNGIDIIMNIIASPKTCDMKQQTNENVNCIQKEREYENERTRK